MKQAIFRGTTFTIFATVAVVAACTSSSSPSGGGSSSGGTSSSGTSSGTASSSGTTTASSSGTSTATVATFCSLYSSYITTCHITNACDVATSASCTTIATAYSSDALAIYVDCVQSTTNECGDAGNSTISTCIQTKMAALTPSTAYTKLATDYCAVCPGTGQTSAQCVTGFYTETGTDQFGPGYGLLEFNDTLATQLDTCTTQVGADAGAACEQDFALCGEPILDAFAHEPTACTSQGTVTEDGG